MHSESKYDMYNSYLDMAKVISYIESGKLSNPFDRLQGVGIFFLIEKGYTFDEIKSIKVENYNNDVIELPNVISLVEDSKELWNFFKDQKKHGDNLISPELVESIERMEFR